MYDTDNKRKISAADGSRESFVSLKGIIPTISAMMILAIVLAFATKIIGMAAGF